VTGLRLETARLILRRRRIEDFPETLAMWSDPVTTRHFFSGSLSREDAFTAFTRWEGLWDLHGYSMWLVEEKATGDFVGEAGGFDRLRDLTEPLDGVLEFGWAIAQRHYGKGYAREAVAAALAWADAHCPHPLHVAIINPVNAPSLRLAAHLGFRDARPFDFKGRETVLLTRARSA
jgi:RimJ/RimL family protein N-acetyltransferase